MFNQILNAVKTVALVGSAVAVGVAIAVAASKSYREECIARSKQQAIQEPTATESAVIVQPAAIVVESAAVTTEAAPIPDPWQRPLDETVVKCDAFGGSRSDLRVPPAQWSVKALLMLPPAKPAATQKNYAAMSIRQLKTEAKGKIKNYSSLTKTELITRLTAAAA